MARKGKSIGTADCLGLGVGTGLIKNEHTDYFGACGNVLKLDCGGCTTLISAIVT